MEVTNETYLLYCIDCGAGFFTEGEKEFYESKGLTIPTRCKNCREKRKNQCCINQKRPNSLKTLEFYMRRFLQIGVLKPVKSRIIIFTIFKK